MLLSACAHESTIACSLLVLHAAQILVYYLEIDQLSAAADCCQQTALEGSEPSPMIVHSSERWDTTSRIVGPDLFCCPATLLSLQCFLNPQFPVSFPLTVSSNGADNAHSESVHRLYVICGRWQPRDCVLVNLKKKCTLSRKKEKKPGRTKSG